jgi:hypothetical protein
MGQDTIWHGPKGQSKPAAPLPMPTRGKDGGAKVPKVSGDSGLPRGKGSVKGFGDAAPGRGGNRFGPARGAAPNGWMAPVSGAPQPKKGGKP